MFRLWKAELPGPPIPRYKRGRSDESSRGAGIGEPAARRLFRKGRGDPYHRRAESHRGIQRHLSLSIHPGLIAESISRDGDVSNRAEVIVSSAGCPDERLPERSRNVYLQR